ncbi:unnamed protein product [Cyprideis torosa]|uniref:Uncharacterized protein n=1 Tax=Cyprideis torosa TaxID=163714 RepID=A0A7R8WSA4_9CRUS|nr:unnamed protein product [Cyprideis torosa]CAG0909322.1 unnamed protein product [Cyprideis torosa]
MRLSTKGRFAVTALMELAMHDHERPLTLLELSETQKISLSYLEQLFSRLRKSDLVEGVRGPGGGYRLARRPSQITVAEIIQAVDGSDDYDRHEVSLGEVEEGPEKYWEELSHQLYDFLDGITLASFVPEPDVSHIARQQDEATRKLNFILPRPVSLA